MKYYIGCSGWRYKSWTDFYPNNVDAKDYLTYYSKVFDFVEIDLDKSIRNNTHNNNSSSNDNYSAILPNRKIINRWSEVTPPEFRFSLKTSKRD